MPSALNFFDINGDGKVTKLEFIEGCQEYSNFEECLFLFSELDTNGLFIIIYEIIN